MIVNKGFLNKTKKKLQCFCKCLSILSCQRLPDREHILTIRLNFVGFQFQVLSFKGEHLLEISTALSLRTFGNFTLFLFSQYSLRLCCYGNSLMDLMGPYHGGVYPSWSKLSRTSVVVNEMLLEYQGQDIKRFSQRNQNQFLETQEKNLKKHASPSAAKPSHLILICL